MKNNNSIVLVVVLIFLSSCTSILNRQFYQVSKFPNNSEKASLLFLTDTTGQIILSSLNKEDFKYKKISKHTYIIESNIPYNATLLNALTKDTIVIYKNKLYYSSDSLKLVFNSKSENSK